MQIINHISRYRVVVLIAVVLLCFGREITQLFDIWSKLDGSYSHGFLLFFYCGYLILSKCSKESAEYNPSLLGLSALFFSVIIWQVSRLLFIEVAAQAMLPVVILALIWSILGWRILTQYLIPVGLLILAVPIWDYLGYPLQLLTVFVDQYLLGFSGIVFTITDVYVHLPSKGTFEVAFGCSGLRYFLVSLTLSLVIADQWLKHLMNRVLIVLTGLFLGLLCNWLRVAIIIYVGDYTNMQSPLIDDHETFGWVLFFILMLPLILIALRMERTEKNTEDRNKKLCITPYDLSSSNKVMLALSLVVIIVPALWSLYILKDSNKVAKVGEMNLQIVGWKKLPLALNNKYGINFNKPDEQYHSTYVSGNQGEIKKLDGYIYIYDYQRTGRELIQYGNRFYKNSLYKKISSKKIANGWTLLKLLNSKSGRYHWLLKSYISADGFSSDKKDVKLSLLLQPFTKDTRTAAVAWILSCGECTPDVVFLNSLISHSENFYLGHEL